MESVQDLASTSLRADAQEFFPIANGTGPRRQLFRHASNQISRLPGISETPGQTYRGRLPQVQIQSEKTLNRLDAVPFTPGNGVLTPTQSNMAVLWYQVQPGTPTTPYQPSSMQYQPIPMSPGWQVMVPASPGGPGYWSPGEPYPNGAMQYWGYGSWHPPSMPPQGFAHQHAQHGPPQWHASPLPHMPRTPQARMPSQNGPLYTGSQHPSPGSSPMGHHSANVTPHGGPAGLGQPVLATVSNNNNFVAAVRSNFAILSEAATSEEGDTGDAESKLQIMVKELETLMALHEVQAVQPSKHARAFPLQRVPEKSNGYITGPKMRSVTVSQTNLSSAVSDGQTNKAADGHASDDSTAGRVVPDRGHRLPLLNARSRRSLRRAIQRAATEAEKTGVQLSTQLEELPQLNSSPQPA